MVQGMKVLTIGGKPLLCLGERILGEIESCKVHEAAESTIAAASEASEQPARFTLEEAFTYDGSEDYARDTVKGVLAVSYLLDSLSKIGGKDVDGRIAQGLGIALRHIAKDASELLTESFRLNEARQALEGARGKEAA